MEYCLVGERETQSVVAVIGPQLKQVTATLKCVILSRISAVFGFDVTLHSRTNFGF